MPAPNFDNKEEFETYLKNPNQHMHASRKTSEEPAIVQWGPKILAFGFLGLILFLFYPKWGETSPGNKMTGSVVKKVLDWCGYDLNKADFGIEAIQDETRKNSSYTSFR